MSRHSKKSTPVSPTMTSVKRAVSIDALRGSAIILMVIYHACYDLSYLQLIAFDFYHHPFWLSFRALIVSLFLGTVGISLYLSTINGIHKTFYQRLLMLIVCATLISGITFALFEKRWVFFGILHFIAVASVFGIVFRRWFWVNIISGCSMLLIGLTVQYPFFNQPALQWIGLMTYKPATEDYVPLLPWFGVVLLGIALGHYLHRHTDLYKPIRILSINQLAWLGQHSLFIYMLHQPFLLGGLWLLVIFTKIYYSYELHI